MQRLNATNENPDLALWVNQARPGDRVIIDIKDVVRRTYQDRGGKDKCSRFDGYHIHSNQIIDEKVAIHIFIILRR